jgi:hypothetical protein
MTPPSLNPGLWYNWYPPIASRRQAKKTENGFDRVPLDVPFVVPGIPIVACPSPLSTSVLLNWMLPGFVGPGFEVGSYKEDPE